MTSKPMLRCEATTSTYLQSNRHVSRCQYYARGKTANGLNLCRVHLKQADNVGQERMKQLVELQSETQRAFTRLDEIEIGLGRIDNDTYRRFFGETIWELAARAQKFK